MRSPRQGASGPAPLIAGLPGPATTLDGVLGALVDVMLPVVLVAGAGALLARFYPLDLDTIGKVALHGFFPFMAYQSVVTTQVPARTGVLLGLAYLLVTALSAGLAWVAARGRMRPDARGVVAAVVLGNNGNFGLPIALLALGRDGLDQSLLIFVWSMLVIFTAGPALLGEHADLRGAARTVLTLPVLWGIAAGLLMRTAGLTLPIGLTRGIDLAAQAAIPLALLALGAQLATTARSRLSRPVVTAVLLRLIAGPLLSVGVGLALGLRGTSLAALVLAGAMPTAVNAFLLAREYGSGAQTQASIVAISTLGSLVTIPLTVALLPLLP